MPATANANKSMGATWQVNCSVVLALAKALDDWVASTADSFTWILRPVIFRHASCDVVSRERVENKGILIITNRRSKDW